MTHIAYPRFDRLLARCTELATTEGVRHNVVLVHDLCLAPFARAFREAHANIPRAESMARKARVQAERALEQFDSVFREARAVALAFVPTLVLPETLAAQPTDTDKILGIRALMRIVEGHAGEAWAEEVAKGAFGAQAERVIELVRGVDAAVKGLEEARAVRAAAYKEARVKFYGFKRVVREAYGAKSWEYRRIHLRGRGAETVAETGAVAVAKAVAEAIDTYSLGNADRQQNVRPWSSSGWASPKGSPPFPAQVPGTYATSTTSLLPSATPGIARSVHTSSIELIALSSMSFPHVPSSKTRRRPTHAPPTGAPQAQSVQPRPSWTPSFRYITNRSPVSYPAGHAWTPARLMHCRYGNARLCTQFADPSHFAPAISVPAHWRAAVSHQWSTANLGFGVSITVHASSVGAGSAETVTD
jgi:hypothetical protein